MFDYGVTHFDAYVDFITLVLGDAPDRWVKEDFLEDEDQLDLEKAFAILRDKFYLVEQRITRPEVIPEILALLEATFDAYKAGDGKQGAFLIQDFEELILRNTRRS